MKRSSVFLALMMPLICASCLLNCSAYMEAIGDLQIAAPAMLHHDNPDYPQHVEVRPSDPVFWANWAPRTITFDNPRGYRTGTDDSENWLEHPAAFIYAELHRTDSQGNLCQRYIARMEHGTHNDLHGGRMVPFAVWHGMTSDRRTIIVDAVEARQREDRAAGRPEMTFGIYVAAWNNGTPWVINMHTASHVIDWRDEKEAERWLETIGPWLTTSVLSEVWYDAGSSLHNIREMTELLAWQQREFGLHGVTEALFFVRDDDPATPYPGDITWHWVAPQMCISRFVMDRDPSNQLRFTPAQETHIINSPNLRVDGSSGAFGADVARDYARRGFIVGSNRRVLDQYINLPLVGVPPPGPFPRPGVFVADPVRK